MTGETNGHVNTAHVLMTHVQWTQMGHQGQGETLGSQTRQNPAPTATIQTQPYHGGGPMGSHGPPDRREGQA